VKASSSLPGLASIIVPCWGQLEFTRQCIAALKNHTRLPWELIVIDNGSTDHTDIYLSGVQDGAAVPVTVITNTTNRGFLAAINQGLKVARGEYLVLLNNDVVVTDGWLKQLIALANAKPSRELTPPTSDSPVISCAEITPPHSDSPVISCAETTPPGPISVNLTSLHSPPEALS
jgi:O-antigen biosynthesis protein